MVPVTVYAMQCILVINIFLLQVNGGTVGGI